MKLFKNKFKISDVPMKKVTVGTGEKYAIGIKIEGLNYNQNTMYLRDGASDISADAFEGGYAIFKFNSGWNADVDKVYGVKYKTSVIMTESETSATMTSRSVVKLLTPMTLSAIIEAGAVTIKPSYVWMAYNTNYYLKESNTATPETTYQINTIKTGTKMLYLADPSTNKAVYFYGKSGDKTGWVHIVANDDPRLAKPIAPEDVIEELDLAEISSLVISKSIAIPVGEGTYSLKARYISESKQMSWGNVVTVDVVDFPVVDWEE